MNKKIVVFSGLICLIMAGLFVSRAQNAKAPASNKATAPESSVKTSATAKLGISAIVIPHHDLVKAQRETFLKEVVTHVSQPATIIVISPNHYESGKADIQTTDQTWELANSTIEPDTGVIDAIVKNGGAANEPASFTNEHGIRLVLDDLKTSFPAAKIVPIILKRATSDSELTTLQETLKTNCDSCLLVSSVDFSHYQPAILAAQHDDLTIRALDNLDESTLLKNAEVDSPAALTLMAKWAKSHDTLDFSLSNHTDSGVLDKNTDEETTSHVFGWYQTGKQTKPAASVSFLLGGDMMFGRMIAHTFLAKGLQTAMDQLGERVFWGSDADIVNLEGPVSATAVPDDIRTNNLVFNFPPQAIDVLKFMHVNAASQANNHSANHGVEGITTTKDLLTKADIQTIGGPSAKYVDQIATFSGEGLTLKVIGVLELAEQPDLAPLIKQLKTDPRVRVMIFPHWGNEYKAIHSSLQESQAHAWIDAGADIVIGAHPHVIEDSELYNGKPIFYSVGNLLFDQTFSTETQQGLLIGGEFTDTELHIFALPVQSKNLKPQLMAQPTKKTILDALYKPFADHLETNEKGTEIILPIK